VWLGVVFFGVSYRAIDDHAIADGVMFALGGALFLIAGVVRHDLRFQVHWDLPGLVGGAIMLYALAAYPVIGTLSGHLFPAAPVFGLAPCPSAIFTVGLLLWTRPRVPLYALVVPLFWLFAQTPAQALALGVVADVARSIVGVVGTAVLVWRDYTALRERLIGAALLVVAVLCLGHDDRLIALGLLFLAAMVIRSVIRRPGGPVPARAG
jgi:hypothetical protein